MKYIFRLYMILSKYIIYAYIVINIKVKRKIK